MQIIVLDKHPINDGRIERHIKFCLSRNSQIFRIHFNRFDQSLSPGIFSQFGERGYRINITKGYTCIKDNSIYFNLLCLTPFLLSDVKKAIKSLEINMLFPTVFHVHDPALLNLAVILKNIYFSEAKIVYDRHEVYETKIMHFGVKLPLIARLYEIRARDSIDGVISVSEEHNKSIQQLFPKSVLTLVPNYPSKSEYNNEKIDNKIKNFKNGIDINLIYVGSLANNRDRDIELLLTIVEVILHKYPNTTCCIGGLCTDPLLERRFLRLKTEFANRFEYTGKISRENTVNLTERAHIGFFLIRPNTDYWVPCSPNKVFEYLICGVIPIIRADVDHSHDFANCSLIFKRETPEEEIIKETISLVGDPVRIQKMMKNALALSTKFTFDSAGENYFIMYQSLFRNFVLCRKPQR